MVVNIENILLQGRDFGMGMNSHPGAGYIPWRTFTLTHVDYPDGDLFAKVMAILSLTPLVIVIIHLTVFACKRDLHTLFYGIGTIGNGILNYVLKQIFKSILFF